MRVLVTPLRNKKEMSAFAQSSRSKVTKIGNMTGRKRPTPAIREIRLPVEGLTIKESLAAPDLPKAVFDRVTANRGAQQRIGLLDPITARIWGLNSNATKTYAKETKHRLKSWIDNNPEEAAEFLAGIPQCSSVGR